MGHVVEAPPERDFGDGPAPPGLRQLSVTVRQPLPPYPLPNRGVLLREDKVQVPQGYAVGSGYLGRRQVTIAEVELNVSAEPAEAVLMPCRYPRRREPGHERGRQQAQNGIDHRIGIANNYCINRKTSSTMYYTDAKVEV